MESNGGQRHVGAAFVRIAGAEQKGPAAFQPPALEVNRPSGAYSAAGGVAQVTTATQSAEGVYSSVPQT